MKRTLLAALLLAFSACGGGGDDDGNPPDAHGIVPDASESAIDANELDAPAGTVQLTVKNYLSWCTVTVDGNPAFSNGQHIYDVVPGTYDVSAVANAGFQLGTTPWHDTDGDTTGDGEQGTITGTGQSASSATTETVVAADDCIWVCCEFTGGGGCDVADQCP
jgi:hypothetical protein